MAELVNPYIAGAPVAQANMFFGREDVFQWIENSIAGQYADHILVIHGQRRVGKTSVLKQLGNRLPKRFIPVFFDLQGRTHTTLDRFLWWLAREIMRVLKQDHDIEIPLPEKEAFSADLEYFENRFLPDLRPVLGDGTLLLTFDEFDNLEEREVREELARPLIDHLRRLMGNAELNFIFSIGSSGRKLENMQAAYTEFFKTALYKKISFLSEEQTRELVTRPVENILEYDKSAVDRIFQIASGHPYFTQLTCHELFAECQRTDERHIKEADVEFVLDDVVERGTVNLKFVWDEASDIEKWCLAALAQLDKTDHRALADYLRKQRVRFSETDLTTGLLHLREKDILTQDNRFVIYLLKLWLQKNRPIEQAREELTEVNPIANRYIEIGLEFKDAGIYDKALESFQEALGVAKDNIQAQVNIALTYMDQKAYDKAILEFEKALTIDDEDVSARSGLCEAHLALGDAARQKGHIKEAAQSYQRVLAINAEHTEARQRMAEIERQRAEKALVDGKDEEALSAFAEALKNTPEDPTLIARVEQVRADKKAKVLAAQVARSERETSVRNWDKAIAALNEALEIAPQDKSILKKIADIQARQQNELLNAVLTKADQAEKVNRWDTAITALNEYLVLKPDEVAVRNRLSALMQARHAAWLQAVLERAKQAAASEHWDEAIAALNEVLSLEPENVEIQAKADEVRQAEHAARLEGVVKQAERAAIAGKWDEAVEALNQGVGLEPGDERLQARLAQALEAKRKARLEAVLRLADTTAQAGKWDLAIDSLNEMLAIEPENVEIQNKLKEVQASQRDSRLKSLRTKARSMARAERFDESLAAWAEYLTLEPEDRVQVQVEIESVKKVQALAKSYIEAQRAYVNKNYDKAIDLFKMIVQQDYDFKEASKLLAQSIELRRTARKWWQSKFMWGTAGTAAVLAIGWFALRPGSPLAAKMFAPPTSTSAATATAILPTATATIAPTPLPLSWARVNSTQFLARTSIHTIAINPSDPGVIYLGTLNAGVFKSIDGGVSWQPAQNGLGGASIDTLVIDPQQPETLYAGVYKGGLYKTSDGGANWVSYGPEFENTGSVASIIVIDPADHQHLYYSPNALSFESQNGGKSWSKFNDAPSRPCPNQTGALVLDSEDQSLYANQWGNDGRCTPGVYQSGDHGRTWTLVGFKDVSFITGLFMAKDLGGNKNLIANADQVYSSTDLGKSWKTQSISCNAIAVDPQTVTTLYCGKSDGLARSTDGGSSWTDIPGANGITSIQAISVLASPSPRLIVGSTKVSISTDQGASWINYDSGLAGQQIDLTIDPSNASVFYLIYNDRDGENCYPLFRSNDAGRTWSLISSTGCGLTFGPGGTDLYRGELHGSTSHNLFHSTDGGLHWDTLSMPAGCEQVYANPFAPGALVASCSGADPNTFFYSNDSGQTWQMSSGDSQRMSFNRLFFGGNSGQRVYAIYSPDYRSDDGGKSWQACGNTDLAASSSSDSRLIIDPQNPDHLIRTSKGAGALISNDGCMTWTQSNAGLASLFVNSVALDPNNPKTLYAGTDGGAYVSLNGGQTWNQVNDGLLGATVIYSIVVDKDSSVYAATPYGIFKLEGK